MREEGYVEEVSVVPSGAYTLSGAASGSTVLYVEDASDFNDYGGQLLIGEEVYDYDTADLVANTITLSTGLLSAVDEETAISVYPISEEKQARVSVSDDSEAITAVVTHALFSRLAEGIRIAGTREAVAIELVGSTWFVVDVIGQEPSPITEEELDPVIPAKIATAAELAEAAIAEAEASFAYAQQKNKTYRQDDEPTGDDLEEGDIWFDTNEDNKIYVFDGFDWVDARDAGIEAAAQAAALAQANATAAVNAAAQAQTDADNAGTAASNAQADASQALADAANAFEAATDATDIANEAQTAANRVRTYRQTEAPTDAEDGDLWFDTDNGNKVYRFVPITGSKTNLVTNPSFETDTLNYGGSSGTRTRVSSQKWAGNYSLEVVNGTLAYGTSTRIPVSPNTTYTLSYYVNVTVAPSTDFYTYVSQFTSGGSNAGTAGGTPDTYFRAVTGGWVRKTLTFTTSATAASIMLGIANTSGSFTSTFYVDGFLVETGSSASTYFEGTVIDGGWQEVRDAGIDEAVQTAIDAQTAADTAAQSADDALDAAVQASADAATAAGIANGKAVVLYQTTTPNSSYQNSNTLWIDLTGSTNTPKRWSGSAWVAVTDKTATDAASAAATAQSTAAAAQTAATNAQNTADGKGKVYYQTTAPTGNANDLWIDITSGNNTPKRWNGSTWVAVTDKVATDAASAASAAQAAASAAQTDAGNALTAAGAKSTVYFQSTTPVSTNGADLWIDTTGGANTPKRYNGSTWVVVSDKAAMDAAQLAQDAAASVATKASIFYQNTAPASTNPNDLWIDTTGAANTPKRYISGSWVAVSDKLATDAAAAAASALSTANTADATANSALTAANGKSRIIFSNSGASGTSGYVAGDIWYQRDGSNNIIAQWEFTGSAWAQRYLTDAVFSSISAGKIAVGTAFVVDLGIKAKMTLGDASTNGIIESYDFNGLDYGVQLSKYGLTAKGGTVSGALIQTEMTSARGVKLNSSGLIAYNASGTPTLNIAASTGAITMLGDLTSGSTVSGATVTGGTVQSESTASRGIKMNSTGLTAYNGSGTPTFTITASTGAVAMLGSLTSGSTIAGATITGTLQTNSTALRGIKLTNAGMSVYDNSGNLNFNVDSSGNVSLKGYISTGSSIDGAIVTGGTVQTESTYQRGIKMNSSGFTAYNGSGSPTFTITASTGAVAMLGELTSGSTVTGATVRGSTITSSVTGSGRRAEIGSSAHSLTFYRSDNVKMGTVDYINPGSFYGGDSLLLQGPGSALMYLSSSSLYVNVPGGMQVTGGTLTGVFAGSLSGSSVTINSINANTTSTISINNGITVTGNSTFNNNLTMGASLFMGGFSINEVGAINGGPTISGGATLTGNPTWNNSTTGGSANVAWNGGQLRPVSSSRRYKTDIEELIVPLDAVYALVPRKYTRKGEGKEIGFIAEEALEIGLNDWVTYNDKGQVESYDYYKHVVALQGAVVDLNDRLKAVEARTA